MLNKILRKFKMICLLPLRISSYPVKRTLWYKGLFLDIDHEIYPDNTWYRSHDERNFDLVNLGSSGGKWAFDYSGFPVKGMNWAQQPQTLVGDFNLLRCYHSILREGGYVLITIMPFTSINKQTDLYDALKYLKIDTQGEPVEPHLFEKARKLEHYPILMWKPALKAVVKMSLHKEKTNNRDLESWKSNRRLTADELEADALRFVNGWKKQFDITDWEGPLTPLNGKGRAYRVEVMRKMVDFCTERGYRPVWVIPPVAPQLYKHLTPKFREVYIDSFLKEVQYDVPLLDYLQDASFSSESYYMNSLMLNSKGSRLFTEKVLKDLKLIK